METVIETAAFLRSAKDVGMTQSERQGVIDRISANPLAGDLIVGSGGCRKLRVAGRNKGKSGGCRVVTFATSEFGVFLLWVLSKGADANLSDAQVNALAKVVKSIPASFA